MEMGGNYTEVDVEVGGGGGTEGRRADEGHRLIEGVLNDGVAVDRSGT